MNNFTLDLMNFLSYIFSGWGVLIGGILIAAIFYWHYTKTKSRQLLNSLLHPLIIQESRRQLEAVDGLAFFEAPLLFESEMLEDFDLTIYVTASRNIQIERLMQRDGISRDYAEQKLATFKEPGNKPSIILQNNGTLEEFKAAASELLMRLTA